MNFIITNRDVYLREGKEHISLEGKEHPNNNLRFGEVKKDSKAELYVELYPDTNESNDILYKNLSDSTILKGSAKFFKELYKAIQGSVEDNKPADVLFFVHGFNTDQKDVLEVFEELEENYIGSHSPIKHIVVFSWPSRSPDIGIPVPWYTYADDKPDAIESGEALYKVVEKLHLFYQNFFSILNENKERLHKPCKQKIHLMVHSMGNQVLAGLVKKCQKGRKNLPELFGEIILIAADIRYDAFEQGEPFENLIDLGERVHIYYRETDFILDISATTKNWSNRLGRYGRRRKNTSIADVYDVNVTYQIGSKEYTEDDNIDKQKKALFSSDSYVKRFDHWYYYTSKTVIKDIIEVLKGGESSFLEKP